MDLVDRFNKYTWKNENYYETRIDQPV
jgi:hypothetical protein